MSRAIIRNGLAIISFLTVALFFAVPKCSASITNVYIAQNGAGAANGADCADSFPVSFFNTAGNWGSGPSQIGPGSIVHLCGTFTGSAGSSMLTFQGSGTSGNPITLLFESNAVLTAPYWSGNPNGAISTDANSWIVIDGGTNGQINATANGTNLAFHNGNYGISIGGNNVTVQNMNIINLYQRVAGGHELADGSTVRAIDAGSGSNNIVQKNTIHDVGWAVIMSGDNAIMRNNTVYHADHGAAMNGAHWYFYGNHVYDWSVWDSDNGAYHHDGVHCYANGTTTAYIYNNRFDGAWGNQMNQPIFLEGGNSTTRCFVNGGTSYSFNNLEIGSGSASNYGGPPTGGTTTTNNGDIFANNLEIGNFQGLASPQFMILQFIPNANCPGCRVSYYNNAVSGAGNAINATVSANDVMDYDAVETCTSIAGCYIGGTCNGCGTMAQWRAASGYEAHGIANERAARNAYFKLGSGCVPGSVGADCSPQSGSPLISAGKNLYSLCNGQPNPGLGALCFDINGNARPLGGGWDIGAYQVSGTSSSALGPPTGLTAIVN